MEQPSPHGAWKVLVVDDEPEVHRITHLVLDGFQYAQRGLEFIEAQSAAQAIRLLNKNSDIAVVLLDVVMETDSAGLDVVEHIRNTLGNRNIRIILRTGQPGQAPARTVIRHFEISDYHSKAELTSERMYLTMYTALATFDHLQTIECRESQLMAAYAEIEELVHIAFHHLQEPVRSVRTLTQRLRETDFGALPREAGTYIDYIGTAVTRMSHLVHDLAEYSKLSRPQAREAVSLHNLTEAVVNKLADTIAQAGATVTIDKLPEAIGEPAKIQLLLENLVSNAIKYRREDVPAQIRVSAKTQNEECVYSVSDNGIGIPNAHHQSIFNIFFRLHHQDKVEGTGIGLAHCSKVIRIHGGKIWVESELNKGTTVYFTLPGEVDWTPGYSN